MEGRNGKEVLPWSGLGLKAATTEALPFESICTTAKCKARHCCCKVGSDSQRACCTTTQLIQQCLACSKAALFFTGANGSKGINAAPLCSALGRERREKKREERKGKGQIGNVFEGRITENVQEYPNTPMMSSQEGFR